MDGCGETDRGGVGKKDTVVMDLHIHSSYSPDGAVNPREIVKALRKKGFAGGVIADHNTIQGGVEGERWGKEMGVLMVPGVEVSTASGHVLGLGIREDVQRGMSVAETIEAIENMGGVAVAAHPYRFWSGLGEREVRNNPFRVVEVKNGRSGPGSNRKARDLAMGLGKNMTGGSDSHDLYHIGWAYTVFTVPVESADDVIDAILRGETDGAGKDRGALDTLKYTAKSVSEWLGRGMKKM